MYIVAVQQELIAQHYLIGGDFGTENHPHSHHYRVEARLTGSELDAHGFLVDIRVLCRDLAEKLPAPGGGVLRVTVWEDAAAWAAYTRSLP